MRWPFDLLYGAVPAEFESVFGLEESVKRLSAATKRSNFGAIMRQAAVGRVSKDRVSLQRMIPWFRNSFAPFFLGEFRELNGRVTLSGRFTMRWWIKAFMTIWFGFCLWGSLANLPLLTRDPRSWSLVFGGVAMFSLGMALVWLAKWLSRKDIAWISGVIRDALSK